MNTQIERTAEDRERFSKDMARIADDHNNAPRLARENQALREQIKDVEALLCSDFPDDLVVCQSLIRKALAALALSTNGKDQP